MANLQVLRKRYKSIRATSDMAEAMKTAATVKYSKIAKKLVNISAYSIACDEALSLFGSVGFPRRVTKIKNRNCLVLFSNNRGFCGGFNAELLRFFREKITQEKESPLLFVIGQKGIQFCRTNGFEFEALSAEDIPSFQDAENLTEKLYEIYASGEAEKICLIYQRFDNMMTQTPVMEAILPHETVGEANAEILFLPDRQTAQKDPAMFCLVNSIYRIMLSHAAGAQAATTIAMRNACDNASKSIEKLETLINRIRQAEVTNSVIETSSFLAGQYME